MSQENKEVKRITFRGCYVPIYPDAIAGYRFSAMGYNRTAREEYLEWENEHWANVSIVDRTILSNGDISIEYMDVG